MVAFAVGGLLGDTLFHLLPEIFLGEDSPEHVRFVLVEPNRNLLLGVAIMVGFVTFVAMDKGLRIATGGGGGHDHSHSHGTVEVVKPVGTSSALETSPAKSTRSRSQKVNGKTELAAVKEEKEINASVKLAGYLNLMYDSFKTLGNRTDHYTVRISHIILQMDLPCHLPSTRPPQSEPPQQSQSFSTKFHTKSEISRCSSNQASQNGPQWVHSS
jgi:hypothetical protein